MCALAGRRIGTRGQSGEGFKENRAGRVGMIDVTDLPYRRVTWTRTRPTNQPTNRSTARPTNQLTDLVVLHAVHERCEVARPDVVAHEHISVQSLRGVGGCATGE